MADEMEGVEEELTEQTEDQRVLELDMEGVSTEFEALPVGVYPASVKEAKYIAASKKSGLPMVKLVWEINDEDFQGRLLFDNYSLKKEARWKIAKALTALGFDIEDKFTLDLDEIEGLPAMLSVGQDEYQGKITNQVLEVMPAT